MKPDSQARRRGSASVAAAALALGCTLLGAPPAWSQSGLDAQSVRQFGGSYAVDCADALSPHLRVTARALYVEQNGQRMTARNLNAVASFFEPQTPPNFRMALIGETRGATQLIFLTYADSAGLYATLDGDLKVLEALGGNLLRAKYRRCDPATAATGANAAAGGLANPAAMAPTGAGGGAPDIYALLADPAFKRAYLRSVGPKAAERWLARFDGPAPPTRQQLVDGDAYVVIATCKANDCYDNNALFLYSAEQERVLGLIQQGGVKTLVGAPAPALAAQLDRLWVTEWRQGQK